MNEVQRAKIVLRELNKFYPKTPIPLKHKNIFTLLISVLLSAQCTDKNVNNVTKDIYPKYYYTNILYPFLSKYYRVVIYNILEISFLLKHQT